MCSVSPVIRSSLDRTVVRRRETTRPREPDVVRSFKISSWRLTDTCSTHSVLPARVASASPAPQAISSSFKDSFCAEAAPKSSLKGSGEGLNDLVHSKLSLSTSPTIKQTLLNVLRRERANIADLALKRLK